ncbi:MAG: hypothetical protein LBM68_06225 [Bacteroidales bacterium]|jgi:hypothetical protein|nr:hypothetical protein [Bacteroidales bacterium]
MCFVDIQIITMFFRICPKNTANAVLQITKNDYIFVAQKQALQIWNICKALKKGGELSKNAPFLIFPQWEELRSKGKKMNYNLFRMSCNFYGLMFFRSRSRKNIRMYGALYRLRIYCIN